MAKVRSITRDYGKVVIASYFARIYMKMDKTFSVIIKCRAAKWRVMALKGSEVRFIFARRGGRFFKLMRTLNFNRIFCFNLTLPLSVMNYCRMEIEGTVNYVD